jgi:penicillin-binding protein 2
MGALAMMILTPSGEGNPRLQALGAMILAGLALVTLALFRVQVVQHTRYGDREQAQSLRRVRLPSARGEIVDRLGVVLANNRPSYDIALYLDQIGRVSKKQDVAQVAANTLGVLSRQLHLPITLTTDNVRNHYYRRRPLPLTVWRDLPPDVVAAFAEQLSNLPGVDLMVTPVRQYPQHSLAAHVLGFVGSRAGFPETEEEQFHYYEPDTVGKQGVERACDEWLRGEAGGYTIRVNPAGHRVGNVDRKSAQRGDRVVLTLDARFQRIVEQALANVEMPAGKTARGAAVVLDPRTGEVLALASVPTFDPNIFNPGVPAPTVNAVLTDPQSPMLNRVVGARYAPGSTFKPVTLLAALEAGKAAPADTVACAGSLKIGTWPRPFGCWNRSGHGRTDMMDAMKHSCDVWFYLKGMATGVENIARMAGAFGLGQATGFDLGGGSGLVPTPAWKQKHNGEKWWDGDTAQLAIGQSFLLATPLQMANLAATLGNGGTVWRPFVVRRVETPEGELVRETVPEVRRRLTVQPGHLALVRDAMRAAIESADGTGHAAAVQGMSVGGKTGTAEVDVTEDGVRKRINRAWFIGFAPFEQPQVALAVVFEDAASGGHTAAPVAGKILAGMFGKRTVTNQGSGD